MRRSSCATVVVAALEGAGVEDFSITESLIRNPLTGRSLVDPLYPRGVFLKIDRIEGGDDQISSAQREWSVRTVDSEPGS